MPLKTLLLCFLLTHCLSGYAQTSPVLLRRIQVATQLPHWAIRVKQNEQRVAQLKSNPRNSFQLMQPEDLSSAADTQYARKLARLQQMLNKNQYLRAYTLQAPVKADLISLTDARLQTLSDFLTGLQTKVTIADTPAPFIVALQLGTCLENNLEIWIDGRTKMIYLMSDNLFTTAAGKYGSSHPILFRPIF